MPLELLDRMPPIMAALIEAGSGPIFRANGFKARLTLAPIAAGSTLTSEPLFSGTIFRQ